MAGAPTRPASLSEAPWGKGGAAAAGAAGPWAAVKLVVSWWRIRNIHISDHGMY